MMESGPVMFETAAFWFSVVLVGFWGFWDFHTPYHSETIRYAVMRRRYRLGVAVYMGSALAVYMLLLGVIDLLVEHWSRISWVPLTAALLATVLLPKLPWTRDVLGRVRRMTQGLALFPDGAVRLTAALSSQRLAHNERASSTLRREIARYGIDAGMLERDLSQSAVSRLEEAQALHSEFEAVFAEPSMRGFMRARESEIEAARLEYRQLLRRVSRAILLAARINDATGAQSRPGEGGEEEDADTEAVSEFIAEESDVLAARYRRLIAHASLSCFATAEGRNAFIARFGYSSPPLRNLPFWPIVAVFLVLPATMVTILLLPLPPPPGVRLLTLSASFAAIRLTSVLWAVVPKIVTRFARPSLRVLPWRSYLFCGVAAAVTDTAIRTILFWRAPKPPFEVGLPTLLFVTSLFPIVTTVGLSILIDLRLRDRTYQFKRRRMLDGFCLGIAMAATDLLVQQALAAAGGHGPGPWLTVLGGLNGFVIGFLVPPSVPAYLNEDEAAWAGYTVGAPAMIGPVRLAGHPSRSKL